MPDRTSDSKLSPKLRATWHASSELDVFGQWAQAFRAPSATELYQDFGAPGSYARIGNPDLKTETSNGFEIGARLNRPDFGGSITGRSEEHTSELQSLMRNSYAVFCLEKKQTKSTCTGRDMGR